MEMTMRFARFFGLVLLAASLLTIEAAHARPGLGGSFGSRGSRTYMPPPRTAATPMARSRSQPRARPPSRSAPRRSAGSARRVAASPAASWVG